MKTIGNLLLRVQKQVVITNLSCFMVMFCCGQIVNYDSLQVSRFKIPKLDSLEKKLDTMPLDTARVNYLGYLSFQFAFNASDKSVTYGQEGIRLSQQLDYAKGIAYCSQSLAMGYWLIGNYSYAQEIAINALRIYEDLGDQEGIAFTYYVLANVYRDFGDYQRAMADAFKGYKIYQRLSNSDIIGNGILGSIYELKNELDSAEYYVNKAISINIRISQDESWRWIHYLKGNIFRKRKLYDSSMYYYRTALLNLHYKDIIETNNGIAKLYQETNNIDSSIFYATEVIRKWRFVAYQRGIYQSASILAENYKKLNQKDSLIQYLELASELNKNIYGQRSEREIQNLAFNEQMRQENMSREREEYRTQVKMYSLVGAGVVFLLITLLLWRNNRQKQTAKEKIERAYTELKSTQQQLIQSEKMASLGEMTAGIAHEIQNPLNFVNNFSEVNTELLDELDQYLQNGKIGDAANTSKDIRENEEKISLHGKKADAIVKSMLQHSRTNSGVREFIDVNTLAEQYLNLAYHGIRAKDKSFNCEMETLFKHDLEKAYINPQDIGRVLLNLYNNAFYAVAERIKIQSGNYRPKVSVSTEGSGNAIQITVMDNGIGIPDATRKKIFQPFFTTKPTGQGTGLGLSMSYDIVKANGGEIFLEKEEGEGAAFTISLPIKNNG